MAMPHGALSSPRDATRPWNEPSIPKALTYPRPSPCELFVAGGILLGIGDEDLVADGLDPERRVAGRQARIDEVPPARCRMWKVASKTSTRAAGKLAAYR